MHFNVSFEHVFQEPALCESLVASEFTEVAGAGTVLLFKGDH